MEILLSLVVAVAGFWLGTKVADVGSWLGAKVADLLRGNRDAGDDE